MANKKKKKRSFTLVVHKKEYYDKLFNQFLETDFTSFSADQIFDHINKIIEGFPLYVAIIPPKFPPLYVYRIVPFEERHKEEDNLVKHFSHPPPSGAKSGRANIKIKPVFYGANNLHTAYMEMKDDMIGKRCFIAKWKAKFNETTNILPVVMNIEPGEESHIDQLSNLIQNGIDQMFEGLDVKMKEMLQYKLKKLAELFSVNDKKHYNITSALAYFWLYKSKEQGTSIPILAYPSVTRELKDINFAIHPDFVASNSFTLDTIIDCTVQKRKSQIGFSFNRKGFGEGEEINWTTSKLRISEILENATVKFVASENAQKMNLKELFVSDSLNLYDYLNKNLKEHLSKILNLNYDDRFNNVDYLDDSTHYEANVDVIPVLETKFSIMHNSDAYKLDSIILTLLYTHDFI